MPNPRPVALARTLAILPLAAAALSLAACAAGSTTDTEPVSRLGYVAFRGDPVTLQGAGVAVGQPAPDFTVTGNQMQDVRLSDFRGRTVILSAVPSIDTGVCSAQTHRFNQAAAELGDDVIVLTLSMDLPQAQRRWCGAEGVDRVITASDFKDHSFADAFGLRIRETGLLARAVYVIDPAGTITYEQIVEELTTEPSYAPVIAAARAASSD